MGPLAGAAGGLGVPGLCPDCELSLRPAPDEAAAMMYEGAVQDLIDELGRLPGVGPKSAQRIAFHLLAAESADVERLASTLTRVKRDVRFCTICGNVAEAEQCRICTDPRRDPTLICVVEEPKDVVAVERTREFRGPLPRARRGDQPDRRRRAGRPAHPRAASPAGRRDDHRADPGDRPEPRGRGDRDLSRADLTTPMGLTVSRLASGLPVGGDLEYADEVTLGRAFSGRRQVT